MPSNAVLLQTALKFTPRKLGPTLFALFLPKPPFIWQDSARTTPAAATNPAGGLDTWTGGASMTLGAAGAARPTSALAGGIYSLTLDGVDDAMSRGGLSWGAAGATICAVGSLSANGNFPMWLAGDANGYELRCNTASRQPEFSTATGFATSPTALTIGTVYVLTGRIAVGGAIDIRVNGITKATNTGGTVAAMTSLNLGQRAGGSLFWPGSFYAGAVVTSYLADSMALKLERWLPRQAGLAI